MSKIIYLHGFASIGKSPKTDVLVEMFGADHVVFPDLPIDPDAVESLVNEIVMQNKDEPLIFVGTSLGGFWANYFAQKWDSPCVLVNPLIEASEGMQLRVGLDLCNYYTNEPIVVTESIVAKFRVREEFVAANSNGALINLFVAKDDEVIPFQPTLDALPYYASCIVKETGGHRFSENWAEVVAKVKELSEE